MLDLLADLTDEQRAAVEAPGNTFLSAGAGSGKTRVLAHRIAHLIAEGFDARRICALTFTRSAAAEIRARVEGLLGFSFAPEITTFHAFAARRVVPAGMRIANEHEEEAAIDTLYHGGMRLPSRRLPGVDELRAAIVEHEATGDVADKDARRVVQLLLGTRLGYANLVPRWDLLPRLIGRASSLDFDHALVDEGQDATPLEAMLPWGASARWFGVFDSRQAIMGWRRGVGLDCKPTHELTRSFRFGPSIAAQANKIAARFGGEPIEGADVPDEVVTLSGSSGDVVAAAIRAEVEDGLRFDQMVLVLARTNRECEWIERATGELALRVRRSPYGDPLESDADRFAQIWNGGRAVAATIHGAKGREADRVVYVRDLEEEREAEEWRVDYVACTRARRRLAIVRPPAGGLLQ